jgi:error-prone DNA polymerase
VLPLPTEQDMVPLPPLSAWQRTIDDYAILQLSPDGHPMAFLRQRLTGGRPPIIPIKALAETADETRVRIAGLVVCRQRPQTASGFLFMVLEDETELANVVVRPWVYERYRALARTQPCIIVEGLLQRRDGVTNVIAIKLRPLELPGELPAPEGHNFH